VQWSPDTNCSVDGFGSGGNIYGSFIDRGDDFYLNQGLSNERTEYERWYINSNFNRNRHLICVINSHGYEVSEVEPIILLLVPPFPRWNA
jgi:hypothetical protein